MQQDKRTALHIASAEGNLAAVGLPPFGFQALGPFNILELCNPTAFYKFKTLNSPPPKRLWSGVMHFLWHSHFLAGHYTVHYACPNPVFRSEFGIHLQKLSAL